MPNLHLKEEHNYNFWTDVFIGKPIKVRGKEHYKKLMAQGGFVPSEKAQQIAYEANRSKENKGYKPSPELISFLRHINLTSDSKGNVQLGSRAIKKMKEFGVVFDRQIPQDMTEDIKKGSGYGTTV